MVRKIIHGFKWLLLSVACGVSAGVTSYIFLVGLDVVTETRLSNTWLVYMLPIAAGITGLAYYRLGNESGRGNGLIFEHLRLPVTDLPKRMGALVLVGSWTTHLFGGSAGREGTAVQLAYVAADQIALRTRLPVIERQRLLICAFAAAFGAAFGVPFGGAVFALEVQSFPEDTSVRRRAALPALIAALVGDGVVTLFGYDHQPPAWLKLEPFQVVDVGSMIKVGVCGIVFGVVATLFSQVVSAIKNLSVRFMSFVPLRPFIGGCAIVGLSLIVGTEALGLSSPLLASALAGQSVGSWVWLAKFVFTAITVGTAMPGGEVTPLFIIGATLGAALAAPLGLPIALLAGVGFVAVFAGASNTPFACVIIGIELLGWLIAPLLLIGCGISYVCSSRRGIYSATRRHRFKLVTLLGNRLVVGARR